MSLSARDIVRAWDWGRDKHAVDRALVLLALAEPNQDSVPLADLSVGQRNGRLLTLRERLLGPTLRGLATCDACGTVLTFAAPVAAFQHAEPEHLEHTLDLEGVRLHFRLPTSRDLAEVVGLDEEAGGQVLLEHCVIEAAGPVGPVRPADLSANVISALAETVSDLDPMAEARMRLTCAQCGHRWSALLDIGSFFWAELDGLARRLLEEVAVLARCYGWSESEILGMSAARRRFYLEMAG
jgi:hypothetical protein